jgi:hypothetical protein
MAAKHIDNLVELDAEVQLAKERSGNWNKLNRPRWPGARQGYPEPQVVVPHPGTLNRAQRRSQGRYEGFLKSTRTQRVRGELIRRSGETQMTRREAEKVQRYTERVAARPANWSLEEQSRPEREAKKEKLRLRAERLASRLETS